MTNMAIKNLSNYKVGSKFIMEVLGHGKQSVEILEKGDKKLNLKFSNGVVNWFSKEELTIVKSLYKKTVEKIDGNLTSVEKSTPKVAFIGKTTPQVVNKPVVKNKPQNTKKVAIVQKTTNKPETTTKTIQKEEVNKSIVEPTSVDEFIPHHAPKFRNGKWVDFWAYEYGLFLKELRQILKEHGIKSVGNPKELLDIIKDNL